MKSEKVVIWAFSGTGKSSLADGNRILDVDSAFFRFYAFEFIFPQSLQQKYQEILYKPYPINLVEFVNTVDADIVLLNCHTILLKHFDNVYLVYPAANMKETFLLRYKNRGNDNSYIEYMTDTYDEMVSELSALPYPRYIITDKHTYLKDIIFDEGREMNLGKFKRKTVPTISADGR